MRRNSMLGVVIVLVTFVLMYVTLYRPVQDAVQATNDQGAKLAHVVKQQSKVIAQQQQALELAACQGKASRDAFASIVDRIADNFATPPYPDPERVEAVDGLHGLATVLRDPAPISTCP